MGLGAGRAIVVATWIQALGVLTAFVAFAFWPPAQGRMLLVPVAAGSDRSLVGTVIDRGGRLLGVGPLPGSLVVSGDSGRIARGLLAHGVLTVAAPAAACGDSVARA